jgi:histone deacetylase complex subunit SAP18
VAVLAQLDDPISAFCLQSANPRITTMTDPQKTDRQTTAPFLLRLFYRTGSFHRYGLQRPSRHELMIRRPEEFSTTSPSPLPAHAHIHTWPTCSLKELTALLTSAVPSALPSPAIGTRICYRLIFPDIQGAPRYGGGRFLTKDLGSVVVGADYEVESDENKPAVDSLEGDGDKTLQDARFVIGDYISCAIIPPLSNGDVAAPPLQAPRNLGAPPPALPRENGYGPGGYGRGYGGYQRGGRHDGPRSAGYMPEGEWRRGDIPPGGGGGFSRGRGRSRQW